jgi:large subunit ribosomal protein L29e
MPKGPSLKLSRLAFIIQPMLGKWIQSYMAKEGGLYQAKPKVQTKAVAKVPAKAQASAPAQAPRPCEALIRKGQCEDRWTAAIHLPTHYLQMDSVLCCFYK